MNNIINKMKAYIVKCKQSIESTKDSEKREFFEREIRKTEKKLQGLMG